MQNRESNKRGWIWAGIAVAGVAAAGWWWKGSGAVGAEGPASAGRTHASRPPIR